MSKTTWATRVRVAVAGSVLAVGALVPLSLSSNAGASTSAFCAAVKSWDQHQYKAPTKVTLAGYRAWVKKIRPYYETMDSTAPNAKDKQFLAFIVNVLKAYEHYTTLAALAKYEEAHATQFAADVQALVLSVESCFTIQLP